MPQTCQICNHPQRLAIDKELVQGKAKSKIALDYNVPYHSLGYHAQYHLSRQLCAAWSKRNGIEAMGLLADIENIVSKARLIFDRNFEAGKDLTALKALDSERATFGLLVEIARLYHETRLAELQTGQEAFEQVKEKEYREGLKRLTNEELATLFRLQRKMAGDKTIPGLESVDLDLLLGIGEDPAPDLPEPLEAPTPTPAPKPLPRPQRVQQQPIEAVPIEEQEPEPEPESKGLPPAPCTEIPGGRGLRLARHLLGRKIYDSQRER
jgi:hypothetical protein